MTTTTDAPMTARQSRPQQRPWHRVRVRFGDGEFEDAVRGADPAEALLAAIANWYLDTPSVPASEIIYLGLDDDHHKPESRAPSGAVTVTARRIPGPARDDGDQLIIRASHPGEVLQQVDLTPAHTGTYSLD